MSPETVDKLFFEITDPIAAEFNTQAIVRAAAADSIYAKLLALAALNNDATKESLKQKLTERMINMYGLASEEEADWVVLMRMRDELEKSQVAYELGMEGWENVKA